MTESTFNFFVNYFTAFQSCEYSPEVEKVKKEASSRVQVFLSDKASKGFQQSFDLYLQYQQELTTLVEKVAEQKVTKENAMDRLNKSRDKMEGVDDYVKEVINDLENGRITKKHAANKLFSDAMTKDEQLEAVEVFVEPDKHQDALMEIHLQSMQNVTTSEPVEDTT